MQQEEAIIKHLAKVIRDAQPQVDENPVLLGKIFAAMEEKRKKRRMIWILFFSFISLISVVGIYGWNHQTNDLTTGGEAGSFIKPQVSLSISKLQYTTMLETRKNLDGVPTGDIKKSTQAVTHHRSVKPNQKKSVKVPPLKVWEFNIYGEDGSEQDALQVIQELKQTNSKRKPQEE